MAILGFARLFLFFAGWGELVGCCSGSKLDERVFASGSLRGALDWSFFCGNGSSLFGGSIWLRLRGEITGRSGCTSGALLGGRTRSSEVAVRATKSGLGSRFGLARQCMKGLYSRFDAERAIPAGISGVVGL